MTDFAAPWLDPAIAVAQRASVDKCIDLPEPDWPPHFRVYAETVRATQCPGSLIEFGCGVGHGREILDRAGVPYASYAGVDISEAAIRIARERYPESTWIMNTGFGGALPDASHRDIVVDGSLLLHIADWRAHIADICRISRRWVILHRAPINSESTHQKPTTGYGHEFPAWSFLEDDVIAEMRLNGFEPTGYGTADGNSRTYLFAKPRHFVTYADGNYLTRLKALYASLVRHAGPFKLHVLAWDKAVHDWGLAQEHTETCFVDTFLTDHPELAIGALPGPQRTKVEHYWTCGPAWLLDCMQATGEPVMYVDADTMLFWSPEPVFAEIGAAPAAVFPHNFAPGAAGLPGPDAETFVIFGQFNVGWLYAADTKPVEHWAEQCRAWCFDRVEEVESVAGPVPISDRKLRYGDQKFLDAWPKEFGAHIVKHPGACLGPWAVHTHSLDVRGGVIHFGNRELVSYHFSSYRELPHGGIQYTRPEYALTERQVEILYAPYIEALTEAKR